MCYFKNLRQSGYLPGLIARLFTQDFGLAPRSSLSASSCPRLSKPSESVYGKHAFYAFCLHTPCWQTPNQAFFGERVQKNHTVCILSAYARSMSGTRPARTQLSLLIPAFCFVAIPAFIPVIQGTPSSQPGFHPGHLLSSGLDPESILADDRY